MPIPPGDIYSNPTYIDVGNNLVFVCNRSDLQIVNVANPASPVPVGAINTGYANAAKFFNEKYVAVAAGPHGFKIVDISNPASPVIVGQTYLSGYNGYSLDINRNYAYVADRKNGVQVIDLTDMTKPIQIAQFMTTYTNMGVVIASGNPNLIIATVDSGVINTFVTSGFAPQTG